MSTTRQSSISVVVRVRPFTKQEKGRLIKEKNDPQFYGGGSLSNDGTLNNDDVVSNLSNNHARNNKLAIRKLVKIVDEKMLIFDPKSSGTCRSVQIRKKQTASRHKEHLFSFDGLFDENATQDQVFNATAKPLLTSVLDGFNGTIFAYGATGCGKTYTISGTDKDPGIIYKISSELFNKIENMKQTHTIEVTASYLEIYNESVRDLLNPDFDSKHLIIREDIENGKILVKNLSNRKITVAEELIQLIDEANTNRSVNSTQFNETSSRSHAVLQINVDKVDRNSGINEKHFYGTLTVIDLAGSERASYGKNSGKRLHEGANINRSLLALGNCIKALCENKPSTHVPYRDSKLTRLLKFSLGGNCKTVMIACVSPSSQYYDETFNTLKYANRAKDIKTKVIRNTQNLSKHVGQYMETINAQKNEIEKLSKFKMEILSLSGHSNSGISSNILAESLLLSKAKLLVKRNILNLQKAEFRNFLNCFHQNYGNVISGIPIDLQDFKKMLDSKMNGISVELGEIEGSLIDINASIKENYSSFAKDVSIAEIFIEHKVLKMFSSINNRILLDYFDIISSNFKFLSNKFFQIFQKLVMINTFNDIESIKDDNLSLSNEMLNESYEVMNYSDSLKIDEILSQVTLQNYDSITFSHNNRTFVAGDSGGNQVDRVDDKNTDFNKFAGSYFNSPSVASSGSSFSVNNILRSPGSSSTSTPKSLKKKLEADSSNDYKVKKVRWSSQVQVIDHLDNLEKKNKFVMSKLANRDHQPLEFSKADNNVDEEMIQEDENLTLDTNFQIGSKKENSLTSTPLNMSLTTPLTQLSLGSNHNLTFPTTFVGTKEEFKKEDISEIDNISITMNESTLDRFNFESSLSNDVHMSE